MRDTLNNVLETGWLNPGNPIIKALIGLLILIVGLWVAGIVTKICKKLLKKISFLKRGEGEDAIDFATPLGGLIRAILVIFVLMIVLEYYGLKQVLQPIESMVSKFFLVLPNMVGAAVIGYAGWVIAKILSDLVRTFMGSVDKIIQERIKSSDVRLAPLVSAFTLAIVFLPILVAAIGVLNIPTITEPATNLINELLTAIPNIISAVIVILVVYYVAKLAVYIVKGILEGVQFDELPSKLGMTGVFSEKITPTKVVGVAIMFFALLAGITAAVDLLGISLISEIFEGILTFGGGVLVGSVILIIGNFLGMIAYDKLSKAGNKTVAGIARFAILGLVLAMGLKAMGLADEIVTMAFGFTFGSAAVAVALAFGLGGRDAAKTLADRWVSKID